MTVPLSFSGGIPDVYDRYVFPANIRNFAQSLGQRVAALSPQKVLEVAAGTGAASECVLQQLGKGVDYTLTDISNDILLLARQRFQDRALQIEVADACHLPYDSEHFDVVICQFGMMYFQEPDQALGEIARVLTPQGHLLFSVWDSAEHHPLNRFFYDLLSRHAPDFKPRFQGMPYSWSSLDGMKARLEKAGFCRIDISVERHSCSPQLCRHAVESRIDGTPLGQELEESGLDRQALVDQITDDMQRHYGEMLENITRQGVIVTASPACMKKHN
ncbi:class I SAM-dependent methyltransferase [Endozoicomonas montiporae]|uniref:Ubiquinone/menaquinone biosynthesis methyltransferase n=1 Tax=Endozoicomonas montiporae CL-33 TaxID=570277 RepID=A0A142BE17_9GAMM|nr:methyltransferase domain-containing protein [Endozoicomonas montiporae]AMO56993.1 ubiquinone/menaquinone biosynthesis methyltransferase [Endozoicomonas montiporae CL-33]